MAEGDDFERRLLLSVDAKGYGGSTDRLHGTIQQGLLKVMDDAAERARLDRAGWYRQGAGDGELAILPLSEPEPRVADDFPRHLFAALRRHNRDRPADRRLRLRMAVHFGTAIPDVNGHRGGGPVQVSRLCDSRVLKAALDVSGADLAVALSDRVFRDVIVGEHTSLEPADFRRVRIREKEYDEDAWVWVPGMDVHALNLPEESARPPAPEADHSDPPGRSAGRGSGAVPPPGANRTEADSPPPASVRKTNLNVFNERVDARRSVFGFQE